MVMRGLQRLLLLASLLSASTGWAAELHGRSSTQFLSFSNQYLNDERQTELAEYLRVSITGIDSAGKLTIQGYGRGSLDFQNGEGLNGRLYYFYGDYRDLFDKVDIRIGRQFVNYAAGSVIVDGGQVEVKNVGPVAFSLMGGRDVIFGLDGETGDSNAVMGFSGYLTGFKQTDAEISWFRKWDDGDVARDIIGATFKQYLLDNLKVYGNTRYDLASETFHEVLGGIKFYPTSDLIFTGEYYQSYPIFDTTSIYSVFAVDRYKEGVLRLDYTLNEKISLNAGYNRQWYDEGATANVYNVGITTRPIDALRVSLEYDNRTGYYGTTNGAIVDASYQLNRSSEIAGGITYDVYLRDSLTGDEIARRYWLGGKYRLASNMAVSGRIQNDVSARYSNNTSGRLTFDYDF